MNRRDFLSLGLVGGINLSLGDYFYLKANDNIKSPKAQSVILIYLPGGYSAQETFDPKPYAPSEYKGPFNSISTKVPGLLYNELLKNTANIADKIVTIRSFSHGESAHERGTNNIFTGYRPSPALKYPSIGSIVSQQFGNRNNLPAYINVPSLHNEFSGSGYLSHSYSPFGLGDNPENPNFKVKDLVLPDNVSIDRFEKRKKMLEITNKNFESRVKSDSLNSMNSFYNDAYSMISSKSANEAFNLSAESEKIKESYGKNGAGMRMLMCRRLVEAGVRFVSMVYGGWDHHDNIQSNMNSMLPPFDRGYGALISDLNDRGLLDSTLVMVMTEFGRTPKINPTGGRDHWPKVFSVLMAGGGLKSGIVYGKSNDTSTDVSDNLVTVEDWASTVYYLLGIDKEKTLIAPGNRPVKIVDGGNIIKDIIL
jgi:hypothetical protein